MNYLGIKKSPNSRNKPEMLCLHIKDNLAKKKNSICIFMHFVTSSLYQKHIFCLQKNTKDNMVHVGNSKVVPAELLSKPWYAACP